MNLEQLSKFLGCDEFKPMDEADWNTFGGANPGTYICYDEVGNRVLFAECDGSIGILYTGPFPYEGDEELNIQVGPIEGFSKEALKAAEDYNRMIEESARPHRV